MFWVSVYTDFHFLEGLIIQVFSFFGVQFRQVSQVKIKETAMHLVLLIVQVRYDNLLHAFI